MWLTPTYHLFALYAPHRGAQTLRVEIEDAPSREACPILSCSASKRDGRLVLSLSNRDKDAPQEVTVQIRNGRIGGGSLRTMNGDANAVNSADQPDAVTVTESRMETTDETLRLTLPPCSVQTAVLALR